MHPTVFDEIDKLMIEINTIDSLSFVRPNVELGTRTEKVYSELINILTDYYSNNKNISDSMKREIYDCVTQIYNQTEYVCDYGMNDEILDSIDDESIPEIQRSSIMSSIANRAIAFSDWAQIANSNITAIVEIMSHQQQFERIVTDVIAL